MKSNAIEGGGGRERENKGSTILQGKKKKVIFFLFFLIHSAWSAKLVNQVRFHISPLTGIDRQQKPQSFYTNVYTNAVDGVSSLVEMVSDRLVSVVFYVSQVFLEVNPN